MKQAKDLVDVLQEANQTVNPKLMDLVEMSKSFGGGRGRRWGGRSFGGGGRTFGGDRRNNSYNDRNRGGGRFESRENKYSSRDSSKYEGNSGRGDANYKNGSSKYGGQCNNDYNSSRSGPSKFGGHHDGFKSGHPQGSDNRQGQKYGNASTQSPYQLRNTSASFASAPQGQFNAPKNGGMHGVAQPPPNTYHQASGSYPAAAQSAVVPPNPYFH